MGWQRQGASDTGACRTLRIRKNDEEVLPKDIRDVRVVKDGLRNYFSVCYERHTSVLRLIPSEVY